MSSVSEKSRLRLAYIYAFFYSTGNYNKVSVLKVVQDPRERFIVSITGSLDFAMVKTPFVKLKLLKRYRLN